MTGASGACFRETCDAIDCSEDVAQPPLVVFLKASIGQGMHWE